nr:MAG TPA: major capsid protein [Caudoviricetes sp.]
MERPYDFSGWATRNDLQCADGRVIRRDAFKDCDGIKVPLVWNHDHATATNVLGHALLENRKDGVYTYGWFNETEKGQIVKELVSHGDITQLSIYANKLKQVGYDVVHGAIREVSLVIAGANPGAKIEETMVHSEDSEFGDEGVIYTGEPIELYHSEEAAEETEEALEHADSKPDEGEEKMNEETVQDVVDSMTDKQRRVMYALIGMAADRKETEKKEDDEEETEVKHNIFETDEARGNTLSHSEMQTIISDAKRYGSMKDSFMAHAAEYGIESIDMLFPEPKTMNNPPEFISREMSWVSKVMNGVHHTPFSRIKSMFADITEDDARARGYIKGNLKKDEVFTLLKRTTTPTTVYKKQKLDRDDTIDITDFDVIAWLKSEMRMMLDEELARAILIGDGRLSSSDDKINEGNIRPIISDADLYTIKKKVTVKTSATDPEKAKAFIRMAVKSRKEYKGSGSPTLFTTEDWLTECLLLEDTTGRRLYADENALRSAMRVSSIVTVPVMEGVKGPSSGDLMGIIVNLNDYNVGADKGGAVNMFDDFDIDYNQMKYLIETRCSGALIKPYSAIVLELDATASA